MKLASNDFVGIDIEDPVIAALFFTKALLTAKPKPRLRDHPRTFLAGYRDRIIRAFAIDHDDFVDPGVLRTDPNGSRDTVSLVFRDNEARYWQLCHATWPTTTANDPGPEKWYVYVVPGQSQLSSMPSRLALDHSTLVYAPKCCRL